MSYADHLFSKQSFSGFFEEEETENKRILKELLATQILGSRLYHKFTEELRKTGLMKHKESIIEIIILVHQLVVKYEELQKYKDSEILVSEFETIKQGILAYNEKLLSDEDSELCELLTCDCLLFRKLAVYAVEISKTKSEKIL